MTEEHINTYKEQCSILRKLKRRGNKCIMATNLKINLSNLKTGGN